LHVVWFKRDLRVTDHAPLAAAAARGPVLPLWIVEPELWRAPDASGRQYRVFAEAAAELRADLAALGQPLVVRVGDTVAVLAEIHERFGIASLSAHQETTGALGYARDRRVRAWARAHGIPFGEMRQNGAIRALASRDGWARRFEAFVRAPTVAAPRALAPVGIAPGAIPDEGDLGLAPDPCPGRARGGRRAAEALLASFLAGRGSSYRRAMSSPLAGWEACSRLSQHFATGSLSIREAWQAAHSARHAAPPALRDSIDSLLTRLAWHSHFIQKLETEPALEHRALHPAYEGLRSEGAGTERFDRWASGETGWPFVDACMRCLIETGWLNFRARAMLVSVATMHLWLDWRAVGLVLARRFADYEPGIHWSQVQMQSGSTGVNTIRMYSPLKQSEDQDPEGRFIRRWVPELAGVPAPAVHRPWACGVRSVPLPIGDAAELAALARARLWSVRRGAEYRAAAEAIQAKHGSRRSGLRQVGSRRPPPRARAAQPAFDLET